MSTKKQNNSSLERVESKLDLLKEHFDSHMIKVNSKLESLDERSDRVDVTLVKQQAILDEHVRRTNLLEKKVEEEKKTLEETLGPIKEKTVEFSLLLKILLGLMSAAGTGLGIKEILSLISG